MSKKNLLTALLLSTVVLLATTRAASAAALWNTGYYAGWMQGYLPPGAIDYTALSHVVHFSVLPRADGTLDSDSHALTAASSAALIAAAHAAGTRVLVCVGGDDAAVAFRDATSAPNLARFVANLVAFVASRGYDGIDLDWEPLDPTDAAKFTALVDGLRTALGTTAPRPLLTAAARAQPSLIASLQDRFDQVNLLSYGLSGPWSGWVTWFDAPLYDGGYRFPSTGALVPSIDGLVASFVKAGVAPAKLGIGLPFYGRIWSGGLGTPTGGATAPRQSWSTAPTVYGLPYSSIMDTFAQAPYRSAFDSAADAAYFSRDDSKTTNDRFVSYDDESALQGKVDYARAKGLGGVMIWELGGGYRANQPAGQRDSLLQALKTSIGTSLANAKPAPTPTAIPTTTPRPTALPPATPTPTPRPTATATATPASTADLWIYRDSLSAPWVNVSWSATVLFDVLSLLGGSPSIQVSAIGWGALSFHSGAWGATRPIAPALYQSVDLRLYSASAGFSLAVQLENDAKAAFPRVVVGTVPAGGWTTVSVPMTLLDPNGLAFDRVDVSQSSGIAWTYSVDDVRLVAKSPTPTPTATLPPPTATPTLTPTPRPTATPPPTATPTMPPPTATPTLPPPTPLPTPTNTQAPTTTPTPAPTSTPTATPAVAPPADLWLYEDVLATPWIDTSWSATVDLAAASPVYRGTRAIAVVETGWGALSLHSGAWGATQALDPARYQAVELAVYSTTSFALAVRLENDAKESFPRVTAATIPANAWTKVSVPMTALNPSSLAFDRVDASDANGLARTFHVDDVRLVAKSASPSPTPSPRPTATPVPPATPTATPTASATTTPTATSTPAPPTATPTPVATATPSAPPPTPTATASGGTVLMQDSFAGADGTITSYVHYSSASFPLGGTSLSSNPSPNWEGDSGWLDRQGGWGYSGRPIDWGDKYFYRFNTRIFAIGDASISWSYRSAPFGQHGYPVEASDAVDLWLRYQTQYNVYALQFDRTNDCIQAKRKIPGQGWSGPANLIANKGVYYSLPTDSAQPVGGAGGYCVPWSNFANLLPAGERSKPRFPALAHDGVTPYDFRATVRNVGTSVQIQLWRAGVLVYSATDDGRSGVAANGETQGTHIDRGYFDSVPGWQPSWGKPITAPGASGFRADNIEFWIKDFIVTAQ